MRPFLSALVFATALVNLIGCGDRPNLVAVKGKVTHRAKGVTGGSVWFHPEGGNEGKSERMSGQLQTDGTFVARTFPHGDGIPPGRYRITLSPDLAARAGAVIYGDASKTPWSADVSEAGLNELVLDIK